MKAIVREKSGKEFSTLFVKDIVLEKLYDNQIRVKMKSSRINPIDLELMKGFPSVKYKSNQIVGVAGSGIVTEKGKNVDRFQIGDSVFFYRKFTDIGAWGEEVVLPSQDVAFVPKGITLEESGAVALPLLAAYEGLMSLQAKKGEKILIHGAGGGVGFAAVQIAKQLGLRIVAHCSDADRERLEEMGVESVVNYKITDFYQELIVSPPDYVFDVIGETTLLNSIRLKPKVVVSTALADAYKLKKNGVRLNWLHEWLFKRMSRSFLKLAKKEKVRLVAQVTGANGKSLQQASDFISNFPFVVKPYDTIDLTQVKSMGLRFDDVGKVLVF